MHYVMRLSGGLSSAVAAERAIRRYGRRHVTLVFADTRWEDEDTYRFIRDLMARWGGKLVTHTDGRTPLQVAEDKGLIPTARLAPCTYELKIKPFEDWMWRFSKPVTALIGLDWREMHRINDHLHYTRRGSKLRPPLGLSRRIAGLYEDFPLLWKPVETRPYAVVCRDDWGIAPPRAYAEGWPHNNCGGRCVRQGKREWLRLLVARPDRFEEVAAWEEAQRAKGGARANYSICEDRVGGWQNSKRVTLRELAARRDTEQMALPLTMASDDSLACMCGVV